MNGKSVKINSADAEGALILAGETFCRGICKSNHTWSIH